MVRLWYGHGTGLVDVGAGWYGQGKLVIEVSWAPEGAFFFGIQDLRNLVVQSICRVLFVAIPSVSSRFFNAAS